jgi:uncharacterized protein (TIGR03083 family)
VNKSVYLDSLHSDTTALAAAARLGVGTALPCCPGWTVARLLGHLGAIYISITKNIREGKGEDVVHEREDLGLDPEFERWFEADRTAESAPPTVVEWFERVAEGLETTLREGEPGDRTWTWWAPDQTVGFWMRRMAQETAVHRWDVQQAFGREQPIDSELARDGIDEALEIYQPQWCRPKSTLRGSGESYHFHRTDGEGEWLVRFENGDMKVSHEHAKADVAIRGPASDLLLFLWHRIPADRLEVLGDASLIDRYFELVPPD